MKNLSIWLPPFSPDYSGAASVMFDFNALTAMHDAAGCTGNYTGYDEPRWYNSEKNILCSGMREMDAVLGDDSVLTEKMLSAVKSLKPELTALVGTPVPMLLGTDLKGLAKELEAASGIPSIGIETTGTSYYDKGIFITWKELIDKFARNDIKVTEKSINIIGANPIDFVLYENMESLQKILKDAGYTVNFCAMQKISIEDVQRLYVAQANIAVSQSGFLIADYLYKKNKQPFIAGYPVGEAEIAGFIRELQKVCSARENLVWGTDPEDKPSGEGTVLLAGEQIFCNSLRHALKHQYNINGIEIGCVFGFYERIVQKGDTELRDEAEIKKHINSPRFKIIAADPFFKKLIKHMDNLDFIEMPHFGISSKFYRKDARQFIGKGGDNILTDFCTKIGRVQQ